MSGNNTQHTPSSAPAPHDALAERPTQAAAPPVFPQAPSIVEADIPY